MNLTEILSRIGNETACPIAVLMRNGSILCGNRNYTADKWKDISVWTIPGGRSDPGETIGTTLRREVEEEVGITEFAIVNFIGEVPGAKEGDSVYIFFCTTEQDAQLMEPEKFSAWLWIPQSEYEADEKYSGFNPAARQMILDFLKTLQ